MRDIDFDTLIACFERVYRAAITIHSVSRQLTSKYGNIHASLTDEQAEVLIDFARRMEAIDLQLGPLLAAAVEHEQAEPGSASNG